MSPGTAAGEGWLFKAQLLVVVKSLVTVRVPLCDLAFSLKAPVIQTIFHFSHTACSPLGSRESVTWSESFRQSFFQCSNPT